MKKIIIILTFVIGLQTYAQKTFEVYNYTNVTIKLTDIITRSGISLPEYHSKPFGNITIAPGGSYTLVNNTFVFRFPFNSPSSVPFITKWERLNANGTITPNIASNVAWTLGNSQVFYNLKFFDGANILREVGPTSAILPVPISGGFFADYSFSNPAANVFFYTIVVY